MTDKNTLIIFNINVDKKMLNIKYLPKRDSNSWRNLKLNQNFVLVASKILSEESIKKNYINLYSLSYGDIGSGDTGN